MPEMNLLQAAEEARRLVRGFAAIEQVAAALEKAGKAEQLEAEAFRRLEALRVEIGKAEGILGETRAAAKELLQGAERKVANAQAKADDIVAEAALKAEQAEAAGKTTAEKLIADAELTVKELIDLTREATERKNAAEEAAAIAEKRLANAEAALAKVRAKLEG